MYVILVSFDEPCLTLLPVDSQQRCVMIYRHSHVPLHPQGLCFQYSYHLFRPFRGITCTFSYSLGYDTGSS